MDFMSTAQVLGNLGEFVGSIAIVISLIYLAVQIRQSSRSFTLAAAQSNRAERSAWFREDRDSPYLPGILQRYESGEALSQEDRYRLTFHNSALWSHIYAQWIYQELGLAGRFATKETSAMGLAVITPGAMEWWETVGERVYPDEFCRYVADRIPELRENVTNQSLALEYST